MIDTRVKGQARGQKIGQELLNEVLYISIAQLLLEIEGVL